MDEPGDRSYMITTMTAIHRLDSMKRCYGRTNSTDTDDTVDVKAKGQMMSVR